MSSSLILLCFAVLVCKVHSQLCSPPILPPSCPPPCVPSPCLPAIPPCPEPCPQIINSNPYVIIDNYVSNALVNALQLLIVSNIIGATVNPSGPSLSNLGPLLDSLICSNPYGAEIVIPEYTCGASYDLIPPYVPISNCGPYYDLVPPCGPIPNCGPYYDLVPPCGPIPNCGPYYDLVPPCGPIPNCGPYYDLVPPCGPIPNCPYYDFIPACSSIMTCGVSYELIPPCSPICDTSPLPLCGLTPVCLDSPTYNGYGEIFYPYPGIETICPNFCGGLTDLIPNCITYPIPDIYPPLNPYYGGYSEIVLPSVPVPNICGCLNEVVAPCLPPLVNNVYPEVPYGPIAPSCYGGLSELPVPVGGELIFPTFPAPLPCNYGYPSSSLPCVRVNTDGYSGPIYY